MTHRARTRRLHGLRAGVLALLLAITAAPATARAIAAPDHSDFDALLRRYVSKGGVHYAAWHANASDRAALASYVARMQTMNVSALSEFTDGRDQKLAFWLNLYNAATLNLVLTGYPVKSIKDLGGLSKSPWEREIVTVEGKELSLNAIENEVIRATFAEPRIHFALNCAAKSCPPLQAGAYSGNQLSTQLEEQTKTFLADQRFTRFDGKKLTLSRIFEWYAKDFEAAAGSVAAWVRPYLPALAALPATAKVAVKHADYDWSLNEVR